MSAFFDGRRRAMTLAALLLAVFASACGDSGSGGQTGTLGVSLTDAAACGFDAVYVTVSAVRVHQSAAASGNDAGWSEIDLNPARKINLVDLTNGALENLGETPLPAGHYTQLRLMLATNSGSGMSNSVVPAGMGMMSQTALTTPSAVQSGIKLINEFDVAAGQRVDLVLDFDACRSVVKMGNGGFMLKPVIRVIPTPLNGIDGFIDPSLLASGVTVTAQQNGNIVRTTVPNAQTGEFFLARLAPGNYDVVLTAEGHATAAVSGVPVTSVVGTVLVSAITMPITLPVSAFHTVSGQITLNPPDAEDVALVAAKQAFSGGPTVTVNLQSVDLAGNYTLNLPVGAPSLGPYGSGSLPIALTAQSAPAGKYAVEASVIGYQTQSANVDISGANATQNFTLTP